MNIETLLDRLRNGHPTERKTAAENLATLAETDSERIEPHVEALVNIFDTGDDTTICKTIVSVLDSPDSDLARETLEDARLDHDPEVS